MPCITDTPEEHIDALALENKRLKGALCAALRTLFDIHTGQPSATAPETPITRLRNADALVDLSDSGVSALWLRDWWHGHHDSDQERRKQEAQEEKRQQLRKQALAKLSDEERTALGHPPLFPSNPSGRRNKGMPGGDV